MTMNSCDLKVIQDIGLEFLDPFNTNYHPNHILRRSLANWLKTPNDYIGTNRICPRLLMWKFVARLRISVIDWHRDNYELI